jgi:hypothetical protein
MARTEAPLAGHHEGAAVVVADLSRSGLGDRGADRVRVTWRREHHELVERRARRHERAYVAKAERPRQGVRDARGAVVGVGVGGEEPAFRPGQGRERAALGRGLGDAVDAAQEQRVMGHQQVRVPVGGLARDREDRVDGEQDPSYAGAGVTRGEADGVPLIGGLGRVPAVDQVHHLTQRRHAPTLSTCCSGRPPQRPVGLPPTRTTDSAVRVVRLSGR